MSDSDGLGPEGAERSLFGFPLSSWRRITGEGAWALSGQVAAAAAGLVAIRLLTELAPREVFGEASLILGAMLLGRQVFLAPVWNAQLRFHSEYRQKGQAQWFSRETARLAWMSAGAFAAAGTCAYLVWRYLSGGGWRPLLALALAGILVTDVTKAIRLNRLNAERRQGRYALWGGAEAWLWPALAGLFLVLWTSTESYLWGQAAGSAAALIVFGVLAYPRTPPDAGDSAPEPRGVFLKNMLAYGLPLVGLSLAAWVANMGDRYILASFMGKGNVGLYVAAYSVASRPFLLANGIFTIAARPVLFEAESNHRPAKARKVLFLWTLAAACTGAVGVLGFWFFGDWVAWVLLAEGYRAGAPPVFLWIALAYAFLGITNAFRHGLLSLGKSGSLLPPAAFGAVACILLGLFFIPKAGVLGAARAKAAGFVVELIVAAWALGKGWTHRGS